MTPAVPPHQQIAFVLGSGLAEACSGFSVDERVSFADIAGVGPGRVEGHVGEVRWCRANGRRCAFSVGRKHYYEGDAAAIDRLMSFLAAGGTTHVVLTCAAGSLDASCAPGDLVLVRSILDLQFRTSGEPPIGRRSAPRPLPGERMPMDLSLSKRLQRAAQAARVLLRQGALASCHGPSYETPAEIRWLQDAGLSLVAMSGAPEAVAAARLGMQVAMIAVVTNWAAGLTATRLRHREVLEEAAGAARKVRDVASQLI